jgi:anti-anti-sigma factor
MPGPEQSVLRSLGAIVHVVLPATVENRLRDVSRLRLSTSIAGGTAIIELEGELDLAGAAALEQELALPEADSARAIVLDLRRVQFMDSSGLRVIVVTLQRSQERGRRFALVPGAAQVMRVFDITRMRERLDFVDDPREVVDEP